MTQQQVITSTKQYEITDTYSPRAAILWATYLTG